MTEFIRKIIYSDCVFFFGFIPYMGDIKHHFLNAIIVSIITCINARFIMNEITYFITNSINSYKEIVRYL